MIFFKYKFLKKTFTTIKAYHSKYITYRYYLRAKIYYKKDNSNTYKSKIRIYDHSKDKLLIKYTFEDKGRYGFPDPTYEVFPEGILFRLNSEHAIFYFNKKYFDLYDKRVLSSIKAGKGLPKVIYYDE